MTQFNDFVAKYYLVFAVASVVLLFALIGYFIEKKNADKKIDKTEELKTINIQDQVNKELKQNNAQGETLGFQDAQGQTQVPQNIEQNNQVESQTQENSSQEKTEENIEILG